jgi:uncharacterized membrane protein
MDPIRIHLLLNHFPSVGLIMVLLFLVYGLLTAKHQITAFCRVSLVLLAIMTIVVNNSGKNAEEKLEHQTGFNSEMMEEHEEAAEFTFWAMMGLGALSLIIIMIGINNKPLAKKIDYAMLVLALFVCVIMVRTGNIGGKIRHSEITAESTLTPAAEEDDD